MEPLAQFAVALAAAFQAAFPTITVAGSPVDVTATWEPDPDVAMEGAKLDAPTIWTIGMGEELGNEHGAGIESYSLLVILQQKIAVGSVPPTPKDQVVALGQLAAAVGRFCRPLDPGAAYILETAYAAAVCTNVKRSPATNLKELRDGLYYTELLTTWKVC